MASPPTGRIATYVVIAGVLIAIAWSALNQAGGPVQEVTGTIQSVGGLPSTGETGPSAQLASVRLADGTVVQAVIVDPALVRPGQVGKVRVYRRVFSGARAYEVIGVETPK